MGKTIHKTVQKRTHKSENKTYKTRTQTQSE